MSGSSTYADWIAVDWGTTHLRAWAIGKDGSLRAKAESDAGMGRLARDGFEKLYTEATPDALTLARTGPYRVPKVCQTMPKGGAPEPFIGV